MRVFLSIVFSLASLNIAASELYVHKDKSGATILSGKDRSGGDLQLEKVVKYDNSEFTKWKNSCSKDRFNNTKSCSLTNSYSDVMVTIISGRYGVYVGRKHYPRTQSAIKIDENAPIYGYEGISNTPQKIIEQMKNGKTAYTRYKEWPYEYNKDGEVDLTGFKEAFNQMLEEYKKL